MQRPGSDHADVACRVHLEPARESGLHPELDRWRDNVGEPVVVDCALEAASRLQGIDVLCWNLAVGSARLDRLIDLLRDGAFGGAAVSAERPLVILAQEAFRADGTVPDTVASAHHGGRLGADDRRCDIVRMAVRHGFSLRYSPSMRNGDHVSDRGNAILSNVRLAGAQAVLLPFVRQRRVAVAAHVAGHPGLHFVSAHLDTHGQERTGGRRRFGAGRAAQAAALAAALQNRAGSLVLGADLNSYLGMSDPAVRALVAAGMHPARRAGNWRHTFHGPLRLLLDHVLYRCAGDAIDHVEVVRLDEVPGDRSSGVFGSDHHPLLARVELTSQTD
jgi:endonuclease/exonuclease/phosphatase family metal-dependent hydrolase